MNAVVLEINLRIIWFVSICLLGGFEMGTFCLWMCMGLCWNLLQRSIVPSFPSSLWSFNFMFVAHSLSFCPSASHGAMLWILCRSFSCPCPKSGWYMSNSEHVFLVLPQGFSGIVTTAICWDCWLSSKSRVMEKEQCCAPLVGWIIFLRPFLSHSHSSERLWHTSKGSWRQAGVILVPWIIIYSSIFHEYGLSSNVGFVL